MDDSKRYEVVHIPLKEIFADPEFNCRGVISSLSVVELAEDIKKNKLHSPIIVQPIPPDDKGHKYRIVAGHRRHKACLISEMETIPCFIRTDLDEMGSRFLNLAENIKRQDLNIVDEAKAIRRLMDYGLSESQMMDKLSMTRGWVQVRCMLVKLPEDIQEEVRMGNIPQQMIRDLYTLKKNGKTYEDMCDLIKAYKGSKGKGTNNGRMNVRIGKKDIKRVRKLSEMLILQDLIYDNFGTCLATRAVAWTAGQINDTEMLTTIKETATKLGKIAKVPEDGCILKVTNIMNINSEV